MTFNAGKTIMAENYMDSKAREWKDSGADQYGLKSMYNDVVVEPQMKFYDAQYKFSRGDTQVPSEKFPDLPDPTTIYEWRLDKQEFSQKYARAKLAQAELLAEETLTVARKSTPERAACDRLLVDTLKWHASKLLPKTYGKAAEEVKITGVSFVEELLKGKKES